MGPNANSTNATPFSFLCQSQSQIWDEATIWKAGRCSVGTNNPASQPALPPGTTQGEVVFKLRPDSTGPPPSLSQPFELCRSRYDGITRGGREGNFQMINKSEPTLLTVSINKSTLNNIKATKYFDSNEDRNRLSKI